MAVSVGYDKDSNPRVQLLKYEPVQNFFTKTSDKYVIYDVQKESEKRLSLCSERDIAVKIKPHYGKRLSVPLESQLLSEDCEGYYRSLDRWHSYLETASKDKPNDDVENNSGNKADGSAQDKLVTSQVPGSRPNTAECNQNTSGVSSTGGHMDKNRNVNTETKKKGKSSLAEESRAKDDEFGQLLNLTDIKQTLSSFGSKQPLCRLCDKRSKISMDTRKIKELHNFCEKCQGSSHKNVNNGIKTKSCSDKKGISSPGPIQVRILHLLRNS